MKHMPCNVFLKLLLSQAGKVAHGFEAGDGPTEAGKKWYGNSAAAGKRKFKDVFLSLYEVYVSAQYRIHV